MSLRGAQGSLRRGFARMVKPLKSGLATSRSREEELRDEREFERLFLLFEAFLHTDRSRPASAASTPSSSPSPAADVDLPLPLRQVVGGRSDSDGDEEKKSKRKRRLSFGRERRKSVNKKESEDDKKNEDDCGGSQTPKAVAIAAELGVGENGGDNKQKNEDGEETRQPVMKGKNEDDCGGDAEEEHEVRFVVGLLNGYLALKRLGAGDKDLTFSLAHNKKKEEERERRELEKLRGEVVLRMTSALADLGALPAAASTDAASAPQLSAAVAAARPSCVARHQSADYRIPASRSSPIMARQNRTSWRGRLRGKEKEKKATAAVSVEEQAGGKDMKPQQQPDFEERSGPTAQKSEEYRFPRTLRLRSCVGFANAVCACGVCGKQECEE